MNRITQLKKAGPFLAALIAGGLLFNLKKIDTAPLAEAVNRLPIWPAPPTEGQLNARLAVAQDEMERAEAMVKHARDMLANARGLQQHLFWNRQIDAFQAAAMQKREKYEAAKKAKEAFVNLD